MKASGGGSISQIILQKPELRYPCQDPKNNPEKGELGSLVVKHQSTCNWNLFVLYLKLQSKAPSIQTRVIWVTGIYWKWINITVTSRLANLRDHTSIKPNELFVLRLSGPPGWSLPSPRPSDRWSAWTWCPPNMLVMLPAGMSQQLSISGSWLQYTPVLKLTLWMFTDWGKKKQVIRNAVIHQRLPIGEPRVFLVIYHPGLQSSFTTGILG